MLFRQLLSTGADHGSERKVFRTGETIQHGFSYMHREFRTLLGNATGQHQFVMALNVDVRGFSSFCRDVDSPQAVLFIKKVYRKLIEEYFPNASFFKPTGDGLLITIPYTEKDVQENVAETINTCLRVLKDFPSFCTGDPMIRFGVPTEIGIGVSMGPACQVVSDGKTLDYCGRALNLASRLMDFARPSGLVFDESLDVNLLDPELLQPFLQDRVYLKGLAENKPIDIYHTPDTKIDDRSRQPIHRPREIQRAMTLRKIKQSLNVAPRIRFTLPSEPKTVEQIEMWVSCPAMVSGREIGGTVNFPLHVQYELPAGKPSLMINTKRLLSKLKLAGTKDKHEVNFRAHYEEK